MQRVFKVRRAIPSEGGVPVTAWGGCIEPTARGGQIGQRTEEAARIAAVESGKWRRPGSQMAERPAGKM